MAEADERKHAAAYTGRQSASTRNPHSATVPDAAARRQLAQLSLEDRVLAQWRAACGNPVSDEAKAQFQINACGHTYCLSDVRLWHEHHPQKPTHLAKNKSTIFLEFFFDGSPDELTGHEDTFTQAFERLIEAQLQEQRVVEFRKKLTARRRLKGPSAGSGDSEGSSEGGAGVDDEDWRSYLQKPVPATELSIRSMREAGCMLRFLVCQTSLSVAASEILGQIAFQEHFPIDGVQQEPSKSTKPLPKWVYGMIACTAGMTMITIICWWQVLRTFIFSGSAQIAPS
mmetsp:Transcript_54012/g.152190  ORF Transcript_54012/g.152190 Transcript_54012/m.152190 type:complete len:285 (-) Transcript_54012:57-911(-)